MSEQTGIENTELYKLVRRNQEVADEELESAGEGYAFPVAEKVRKMEDEMIPTGIEGIELSKQELFKVCLRSLKTAWEQAIRPRVKEIRARAVDKLKAGTDFWTEADTGSEEIIKRNFLEVFGAESIRIFGEEANKYLGNINSKVGIRIDPIDGTVSFKFSKNADWGIMIGIYTGTPENEKQIMSATYFPEREMFMYYVDGVGVFTTSLAESSYVSIEEVGTKEYGPVPAQDELKDVIVTHWKHTDFEQRGNIKEIEHELARSQARIRSADSACADVLEALQSNGKRILLVDGDYTQVDFIPHPALEKLGYRIYDWQGNERRFDDVGISNEKLVIVPPGKAGEKVLDVVKQFSRKF